jgi:hypothetical protein
MSKNDVIVDLHVKLDRAKDEIAVLKNLLAECAAWFHESNITTDLAARCAEAAK